MNVEDLEYETPVCSYKDSISIKEKHIDRYLKKLSDRYILAEMTDSRWKGGNPLQEGVVYINPHKRTYKVIEDRGKICEGLLPDDENFQFLEYRLRSNDPKLLKTILNITLKAGHTKPKFRIILNQSWTKAILRESIEGHILSSDDSMEQLIYEAICPYETLLQAFDHTFLNLKKYLYGKNGWSNDSAYYDEITDPLVDYYKPDIYTISSSIHEYVIQNHKSKTLGIILLRCYITHCIRTQVKILKNGTINFFSFFKKNKVKPGFASILWYIVPLIAIYILRKNGFSNIAYIILYPYYTILFLRFISFMRARKFKKASSNIIETLLFIGYTVENKIFDCDEIMDRVKILLQKYPDLYLPELIPLVKQISANSLHDMNGNGLNKITERGFFLFEGLP